MFYKIILPLLLFALLIGCSKSDSGTSSFTEDCTNKSFSFAIDVNPIIQTTCATNAGCHASGSPYGALTSYPLLFNQRSAIYNEVKTGRMPKDGSLTAAQKTALLCWLSSGAPNN